MLNFFNRKTVQKPKFLFTTKSMARATGNGDCITSNGAVNRGDFISINDAVQLTYSASVGNTLSSYGTNNENSVREKPIDERKTVEPKAVFEEIKREITPEIYFDNLPEKIKVVEERINVLKEHLDEAHLGDEHRALFYLRNRAKYLETKKKNPLDWAMTNQEAIDDLCKRYKLQVVPLKQYYTLVPEQGIKEMNRYSKAYKAITGDTPIFELIIKDTAVLPKEEAQKTKKKDRDPILLANSPLGNFMFILGAWDDEVEVVDEIIYGLK